MRDSRSPGNTPDVTQDAEGRLKTIGAEGELLPGPIMKIGNTNATCRNLRRLGN